MYRLRLRSFNNPRTNHAACTIQQWFRQCRHKRTKSVHIAKDANDEARRRISKWLLHHMRLKPVNDVDPITLEPPTPPVFKHINSTGKLNAFDARTLATYFRTTGNFIHPVTREPFTRLDVLRLQNLLPLSERNLVELMPQLAAARDASLTAEGEIRVAEMAAHIILENIHELSMVASMHPLRQLRLLYNILLPDLLMVVSSVAVTHGTDAGRQIATNAITWLEAQQMASLTSMHEPANVYNMVTVLETTRRELARVATDLESVSSFFPTETTEFVTISAIVF